MPVLGGSPYSTAGDVFNLVRSLLNDAQGSFASSGGIAFADNEVPSGTIDGANLTFTLAQTPSPAASLALYLNGLLMKAGTDFTLSGNTISFILAPQSGDLILASYRYASATVISVGDVFTDTVLLPLANAAYHRCQADLLKNGISTMRGETEIDVDAGVTAILDVGVPALPSDFIAPLILWEKRRDEANAKFIPMDQLSPLPDLEQGTFLRYYDWREDGLHFIGATVNQTVRMRYERLLFDLVDANSPVQIRFGKEAVAYYTAGLAAQSRGAPGGDLYSLYDQEIVDLVAIHVRSQQYRPVRRKPYGARVRAGAAWV